MIDTLSKYQIEKETIKCDGFSNVVVVERKYKLHRGESKSRACAFFHSVDRKIIEENGVKITFYAIGWGDAKCKTFDIALVIIPNKGRVIYADA